MSLPTGLGPIVCLLSQAGDLRGFQCFEDWSLQPCDPKWHFSTVSMIGLVFGLQKNVCVHTCIYRQPGFYFGGFAHGIPGGMGGLWGLGNAQWTAVVVKVLCRP